MAALGKGGSDRKLECWVSGQPGRLCWISLVIVQTRMCLMIVKAKTHRCFGGLFLSS